MVGKNIAIRVDSSFEIGSGHVMRCLTLAEELRSKGLNIYFICRNLPGNLIDYIKKLNFKVLGLPPVHPVAKISPLYKHSNWLQVDWKTDVTQTIEKISEIDLINWLIIDHYAIGFEWESTIKKYVKKIFVIDDLADRAHNCDVILDPNSLYDQNRYDRLVPPECKKFIGPKYTLLRKEFELAKKDMKIPKRTKIQRILVSFGGNDLKNETYKTILAIKELNIPFIQVDIIVGKNNPHKDFIKKDCLKHHFNYYCQIKNIAQLMINADIGIGAGGSTTWEMCFLGLPSLIIITADNQKELTEKLHQAGAIRSLGRDCDVSTATIKEAIANLINDPSLLNEMSERGLCIMSNSSTQEIINILVGG